MASKQGLRGGISPLDDRPGTFSGRKAAWGREGGRIFRGQGAKEDWRKDLERGSEGRGGEGELEGGEREGEREF